MKKRCWTNPKTSSNKPEVLEIDKRPSHDIPHLATGVVAKMLNGIMEPCRPENIIKRCCSGQAKRCC